MANLIIPLILIPRRASFISDIYSKNYKKEFI